MCVAKTSQRRRKQMRLSKRDRSKALSARSAAVETKKKKK